MLRRRQTVDHSRSLRSYYANMFNGINVKRQRDCASMRWTQKEAGKLERKNRLFETGNLRAGKRDGSR